MTQQQTVGIGVRLLALWLALSSIQYFTSVPVALAMQDLSAKVYQSYLWAAALLGVALLLWFFPMTVAHRLLPRTSFQDKISVETIGAARVGCALLGLWLFAKELPTFIWLFFSSLVFSGPASSFGSLPQETKVDFAVSLFKLGFGLFLLLRSDLFARLIVLHDRRHADRE